jgi:membrane protein
MQINNAINVLKLTFNAWRKDDAPRLGAALAYYTVFSIAPLLIIAMGIVGLIIGESDAQTAMLREINELIGSQGTAIIKTAIENTRNNKASILATITGFIALLIGATTVFAELQADLNRIWNVKQIQKSGFLSILQTRLLSFGMVLVLGFLLLVSLIISAVLSSVAPYILGISQHFRLVLQILNTTISFGVILVLFAAIFKYLPDITIRWKDVWTGAFFTTILFMLGKFLIGLYLGKSTVASTYGAAGSLIILLIWIYYSSQILFFGAEFIKIQTQQLKK